MSDLVNQPTGAPTRKVFGSFIVAVVGVFLNVTLPVLFPGLRDNPAFAPIYELFLVWAPLLVAAAGYQIKEWGTPDAKIDPELAAWMEANRK